MDLKILEESLKKGGSIHIKKKNKGKFTDYCGGKVTQSCINKAKASGSSTLKKRAVFAENARKWKHLDGGVIQSPFNYFLDDCKNLAKFQEGGTIFGEFHSLEKPEENVYNWSYYNPFEISNQVELPVFFQTDHVELAEPTEFKLTYKDYDLPKKVSKLVEKKEQKSKPIVKTGNNIKDVFNYFINKGLTPEQASGFVGNFMAESYDDIQTNAINESEKKAGIRGYGRGIALWSNSRVDDFKRVIGVSPEDATLELQLDFTWYEMKNRPALMNALKQANTPEEAADIAYRGFENGNARSLATPELLKITYGNSWKRLGLKDYDFNKELAVRANKARKAIEMFLT